MDSHDWLPDHPVLRPGLVAVRRDDRHLQVGVEAGDRLVLPDDEGVRRLLADLTAGRQPAFEAPGCLHWCRELVARGFVVDADLLDRALRGTASRAAVLATFARWGPDAPPRLAARANATVALDADPPWRPAALRLLGTAGLRAATQHDVVAVRLCVNRDFAHHDSLMATSVPHLVVTELGGRISVGPFVAPGLTACVRCVVAHRCDNDPGHAAILERHRLEQARAGTGPGSVDPVRMHLALAYAVQDLVAFVEGDPPATWSATVKVDPGADLTRQEWLRHPRCGCCWGDGLALAG